MEGPEPPLSPGEIRLLRLLLSRALEDRVFYGTTLGPEWRSTAVSVDLEAALSRRDFEACGQPVPPQPPTLAPDPVANFIISVIFYGLLFVLLVFFVPAGTAHFGPRVINFARKLARLVLRLYRRYFTAGHAA